MNEAQGYAHPELLASSAWLAEHLSDPGLKVIDARGAREYEAGHIPGAIVLPSPAFKAAGSLETCSAEEFAHAAGALGIRSSDTVVCYDSSGPTAARAWWAFTRFGHPAVRFLHGGMRQWQASGHSLVTEPTSYEPTVYELGESHDEVACALPQAVASLGKADVLFWDVRSAGEYSGEDGRNNPPDRVGHIPGAVHLEWSDLTDPATGFFKPAEEMRRLLEAKGITTEKEVLAY